MDIYWRDSYTFPTEDEYKEMVQRSKCVLPTKRSKCVLATQFKFLKTGLF